MNRLDRDTGDGLAVGFLGYVGVAAFYSLFDLLASRGTLFTVNLLGRAVFHGPPDPTTLQYPVDIDGVGVLGYNALHLVASLVIGLIVLRFVGRAEQNPREAPAMLALIVAGYLGTVLVVGWLSSPIRPLLPWWTIVAANSAAVVLGTLYVVIKRPGVASRMLTLAR
jgi:hypothetical protein